MQDGIMGNLRMVAHRGYRAPRREFYPYACFRLEKSPYHLFLHRTEET